MSSIQEIGQFVNSLSQKDMSFARRAYAYTFIQENFKEIEEYLELRITRSGSSLSTIKWAQKIRKTLELYSSEKPKFQYYDNDDATLKPARSFEISGNPSFSLTFNSPRISIRFIGYIITVLILLFLSYLTYEIISSFRSYGEHRALQIKKAIP